MGVHVCCILHRGEQFRQAFRRLCDVRSFMKADVHVMALTATAMMQTHDIVFTTMGMKNMYIVSQPPEKANFRYSVSNTATFQLVLSDYSNCKLKGKVFQG